MRVLVCGGRNYEDRALLFRVLDGLHDQTPFSAVIHGAARGADTFADHWAAINNIPQYRFHARWGTEGGKAGPLRNQRMLDKGKPDLVVGFPGNRGTRDMLRKALDAGVRVLKVRADGTVVPWRKIKIETQGDLFDECGSEAGLSECD